MKISVSASVSTTTLVSGHMPHYEGWQ